MKGEVAQQDISSTVTVSMGKHSHSYHPHGSSLLPPQLISEASHSTPQVLEVYCLLPLDHTAPMDTPSRDLASSQQPKTIVRPRQHGWSRLAANLPLASTHHLRAFKLWNQHAAIAFTKPLAAALV